MSKKTMLLYLFVRERIHSQGNVNGARLDSKLKRTLGLTLFWLLVYMLSLRTTGIVHPVFVRGITVRYVGSPLFIINCKRATCVRYSRSKSLSRSFTKYW